jgi:lysosomal Pro-X carboxypeptidase
MLSSWFRMKYPNIVAGAIAASAPIWQFTADCDSFSLVTTNAYKKADPVCADVIRSSWEIITNFSKTASGLRQLTKTFRLCDQLESGDELKDWLNDMYGNAAMANYPYPTSFLSNLPAWPVKAMCSNITKTWMSKSSDHDPMDVLEAIYRGANLYQNYTGDKKCLDTGSSSPMDINMNSWIYQTCTEFVFPSCSNGKTDMFEPVDWNFPAYSDACHAQFGTRPRQEWPTLNYGGTSKDIKAHSNIVFSNGGL